MFSRPLPPSLHPTLITICKKRLLERPNTKLRRGLAADMQRRSYGLLPLRPELRNEGSEFRAEKRRGVCGEELRERSVMRAAIRGAADDECDVEDAARVEAVLLNVTRGHVTVARAYGGTRSIEQAPLPLCAEREIEEHDFSVL